MITTLDAISLAASMLCLDLAIGRWWATPAEKQAAEPCPHGSFAIIAAQPVKVDSIPCAHTVILRRCGSCREHSTFVLAGDWSLGDLTRERSEVEELRKIYGGAQ